MCGFVVGSRAMGCFLELTGTFGNYSELIPRHNENARHHATLGELITYSIYDWEEDGSIGNISVPVQFLTSVRTSSVYTSKSESSVAIQFGLL